MMAPKLDKQGELKGEVLARAYELMRYDAITLGETDLFYGPHYLAEMISTNGLPAVSINVTALADSTAPPTKTGMPPCGELVDHPLLGPEEESHPPRPLEHLPPYVIKDAGGLRVALIGMTNHRVILPELVTDSISIAPMEDKLGELLPELRKDADLLVALVHAGTPARARALADSFPQLDIVIAGHVEPVPPPFYEEKNGTLVAYVKGHGRYMGRLNLLLDEKNKVIGFGHDMVPMGPELGNNSGVLGLLTEYIDRLKILVASTAFRPTAKDLYRGPTNYVTANACRECHADQFEQWGKTPHAHAFDTLENKQRAFDPDCQKCHTTGFRYRTGFVTPRGSPHFKHVQCEACHGPGGDHIRNPSGKIVSSPAGSNTASAPGAAAPAQAGSTAAVGERVPYGIITERSCTGCHTEHNSPEFEYNKYLKDVKH